MRADDILMGDALSAAGYVTGYWGKWGYGGSKDPVRPVIENIQTLPTSHGYKYVLAELHHVRAHTFFQPTLWSAPAASQAVGGLELIPNSLARYRDNENYPSTPALQSHSDYPEVAYCDDAYAFAALDFVREQGQNYNRSGQPFFGLLAVQIPHAPFGEIATLPEWDRAYATDPHFSSLSDQTRQWAAMVTRIDAHFGNILAALDDPNNDGDSSDSIVEDTLVVFQSDNGGPAGKNNSELDANGGLRGNKGKIQEGGIRVPLVMRWPAKITADSKLRAGTDCEKIVDVTDLLPTFCELAGVPAPVGIDGVSIAPTLLGRGHQRYRDFIVHEASNGQSIIRGKYKLVRSKSTPLRLYDLDADHSESDNIASQHPRLVKELEALLLGERVAEPKGFANTYHHWIGEDGAATSDPENWSDYEYANAGITYMSDDGSPRLSWIGQIKNSGNGPHAAHADMDLEFLGLEIAGNVTGKAEQALILGPKVDLLARNEIRLAPYAKLTLDGGCVSSLRWLDIHPNATLNGQGTIQAVLYNQGSVILTGREQTTLRLDGDYHQSDEGELKVTLAGEVPAFHVAGVARLGGTLSIEIADGFEPAQGTSCTVLSAEEVAGTFANAQDEVVSSEGTRFSIRYLPTAVTLIKK